MISPGTWNKFKPDWMNATAGTASRLKGCEIVSWVVAMGVGQIITLRLPARLLNTVNVELERRAWGVFSTEFYPTYDFLPVPERLRRESNERVNRWAG
jgi:hypothetical protein